MLTYLELIFKTQKYTILNDQKCSHLIGEKVKVLYCIDLNLKYKRLNRIFAYIIFISKKVKSFFKKGHTERMDAGSAVFD